MKELLGLFFEKQKNCDEFEGLISSDDKKKKKKKKKTPKKKKRKNKTELKRVHVHNSTDFFCKFLKFLLE